MTSTWLFQPDQSQWIMTLFFDSVVMSLFPSINGKTLQARLLKNFHANVPNSNWLCVNTYGNAQKYFFHFKMKLRLVRHLCVNREWITVFESISVIGNLVCSGTHITKMHNLIFRFMTSYSRTTDWILSRPTRWAGMLNQMVKTIWRKISYFYVLSTMESPYNRNYWGWLLKSRFRDELTSLV